MAGWGRAGGGGAAGGRRVVGWITRCPPVIKQTGGESTARAAPASLPPAAPVTNSRAVLQQPAPLGVVLQQPLVAARGPPGHELKPSLIE